MTANEAKIRQCYKQGLTTVESIMPHVACSKDTVSRTLNKITSELQDSSDLLCIDDLCTKALRKTEERIEGLEKELDKIETAMIGVDADTPAFSRMQTMASGLRKRLDELNNVELLRTINTAQAKQKVKNADEQGKLTPGKSNSGARPSYSPSKSASARVYDVDQ